MLDTSAHEASMHTPSSNKVHQLEFVVEKSRGVARSSEIQSAFILLSCVARLVILPGVCSDRSFEVVSSMKHDECMSRRYEVREVR